MSWLGTTPLNAAFAYTMGLMASKAVNLNTGGDNLFIALFTNSVTPDRTPSSSSTPAAPGAIEYHGTGQWVVGSEVTSTGYAPVEMAGQSISQSGATVYLTSSTNPQWSGVTFTGPNEPYGLFVYDASTTPANIGICYNYFGQQTVNGGSFTVVWPTTPVAGAIASWAC